MVKKCLFILLLISPFILTAQKDSQSKIRSFQLGLNTGIGYNQWEGNFSEGDLEEYSGVSLVNSIDFLYRINRFKLGVGLGLDQYFLDPYDGNNTTFFPKINIQTEYLLSDGKFKNGPNVQFGVMFYNIDNGPENEWKNAHTSFVALGWTFQYEYTQDWSVFLKPTFEYKWPRVLTEDERIYSMYLAVGLRYRISKS